ncbi:MAG: hypothetical protein WAN50_00795 [Minisyncoccia bacterium]
MKTISQHIETIREQPHHVRKGVAFGTATVVTALIALVWAGTNLALGGFAIKSSNFAESTGQEGSAVVTTSSETDSSNLAGAAAVVPSASAPAQIQIVDTSSSSTKTQQEQTTIPF